MYKYHVTCGMEKKLVNIDRKDSPAVFSALQSTFRIDGDFLLQLQDADPCDWVDLTETESLSHKDYCARSVVCVFTILFILLVSSMASAV